MPERKGNKQCSFMMSWRWLAKEEFALVKGNPQAH